MDSRVTRQEVECHQLRGKKGQDVAWTVDRKGGWSPAVTAASFSLWHTHCPALCAFLASSLLSIALISLSPLVSGDAECHVPV